MLTVMEFNRNKQNEIQLKCKEKYICIETGLAENSLTIDFKNLKEVDELIFYLEKFKERVRKNKCEEWLLQSCLVMKRVKNCAECPCYYKGKWANVKVEHHWRYLKENVKMLTWKIQVRKNQHGAI